uniref:Transmembrane protein 218 n=1 Tax=Acrobeloides nanus TaxID=290746 RepID=A0A914EBT8_9BILA
MSARIAGLGLGVIILTTLWAICLALFIIMSRRRGIQSGFAYIVLALLITVILYFWPKHLCEPKAQIETSDSMKIDYLAIPRIVFIVILSILLIIMGINFVRLSLMNPVHAKPLKSTKNY